MYSDFFSGWLKAGYLDLAPPRPRLLLRSGSWVSKWYSFISHPPKGDSLKRVDLEKFGHPMRPTVKMCFIKASIEPNRIQIAWIVIIL